MPPERLFRPFQGRTVTDMDRLAEGASLPLPADTPICGCGAVVVHPSHQSGALHRARTLAEAGPSNVAAPAPGPSAAAQVMVQRAARDPEFAEWLLGVASGRAADRGAPAAQLAGADAVAAGAAAAGAAAAAAEEQQLRALPAPMAPRQPPRPPSPRPAAEREAWPAEGSQDGDEYLMEVELRLQSILDD